MAVKWTRIADVDEKCGRSYVNSLTSDFLGFVRCSRNAASFFCPLTFFFLEKKDKEINTAAKNEEEEGIDHEEKEREKERRWRRRRREERRDSRKSEEKKVRNKVEEEEDSTIPSTDKLIMNEKWGLADHHNRSKWLIDLDATVGRNGSLFLLSYGLSFRALPFAESRLFCWKFIAN